MKIKKRDRTEIVNIILIINMFTLIFVFGVLPIILDSDEMYCIQTYDLGGGGTKLYMWVDCEDLEPIVEKEDCLTDLEFIWTLENDEPTIWIYRDGCGNSWDSKGKLIGYWDVPNSIKLDDTSLYEHLNFTEFVCYDENCFYKINNVPEPTDLSDGSWCVDEIGLVKKCVEDKTAQ